MQVIYLGSPTVKYKREKVTESNGEEREVHKGVLLMSHCCKEFLGSFCRTLWDVLRIVHGIEQGHWSICPLTAVVH